MLLLPYVAPAVTTRPLRRDNCRCPGMHLCCEDVTLVEADAWSRLRDLSIRILQSKQCYLLIQYSVKLFHSILFYFVETIVDGFPFFPLFPFFFPDL